MDNAAPPATPAMSFLARLKLFSTLTALVAEKIAIMPSAPMAAFKAAMTISKIVAMLRLLGFDLKASPPPPTAAHPPAQRRRGARG